jgi:hypothetical protein
MSAAFDLSRRKMLRHVAWTVALSPLASVKSQAEEALVSEDDPAARELHYVTDVRRAQGAQPNSSCATCSIYQGADGSAQGGCLAFGNRLVKATGWCAVWTSKADAM